MGKKVKENVDEKLVGGNVVEALTEMEEKGGDQVETKGLINFDDLDKDVKAYEHGVNKSGRSKSSAMSKYRETLKQFLAYRVAKGDFKVEVGAIVSNFAIRILGGRAAYRKSYNYFWSCVQHNHIPEGWDIAARGEKGCDQNTLIYTPPQSPDDPEAGVDLDHLEVSDVPE